MHRERADCRGCHEQIDPLGFALENYDPIGNWRSQYENGREVDMAGTLFRKHPFKDVIEFKDAILAEKDRFTRGLAGHLLSFALARELGPADQIALDQIAERPPRTATGCKTLLKEVIFSEPFQTKTNPSRLNAATLRQNEILTTQLSPRPRRRGLGAPLDGKLSAWPLRRKRSPSGWRISMCRSASFGAVFFPARPTILSRRESRQRDERRSESRIPNSR